MQLKNYRIFTLAPTILALNLIILPQAEAGAFSPTGEMTTLRSGQTATLLTNGMVLIAGGIDDSTGQPTASAEIYDPATGTWKATAPMSTPRMLHTATLLPDGDVLVAGGSGTNLFAPPYFGTLTNAELYHPAAGTWTPTGSMNMARQLHTASLLSNGKVLVAGGAYDLSGSAELYDPGSGQWTYTGTMTTNRDQHTATVLTNGMVLVAGGQVSVSVFNSKVTATAELYNPADGTWAATGSMTTNRIGQTATLLKNGKVLVVANDNGDVDSGDTSAELYDPVSGTWSATGSMHVWRREAAATLLPDGEVLVTGGDIGGSQFPDVAEIYNPDTGQ
ncbi:MAG TPA: kelch repeat-containing protein [Verrucomicrobiae bacterium]|nr:kelch repeat-containing protein [Verrucomicrobiae bacterium]